MSHQVIAGWKWNMFLSKKKKKLLPWWVQLKLDWLGRQVQEHWFLDFFPRKYKRHLTSREPTAEGKQPARRKKKRVEWWRSPQSLKWLYSNFILMIKNYSEHFQYQKLSYRQINSFYSVIIIIIIILIIIVSGCFTEIHTLNLKQGTVSWKLPFNSKKPWACPGSYLEALLLMIGWVNEEVKGKQGKRWDRKKWGTSTYKMRWAEVR